MVRNFGGEETLGACFVGGFFRLGEVRGGMKIKKLVWLEIGEMRDVKFFLSRNAPSSPFSNLQIWVFLR